MPARAARSKFFLLSLRMDAAPFRAAQRHENRRTVGAEMPRTGCVCEIGSLKLRAKIKRGLRALLFSRILLERVMMVNPFLVICSLYYTILSSRNFLPILLKIDQFCSF